MNYYCEHRLTKQRKGNPVLVPLSDLPGLKGFRSVYAWDELTAERIIKAGATKGLRGHPVYADVLLVDFDDEEAAARRCVKHMINEGYEFCVYNSGNRSIHLHIRHDPILAPWLPAAHKEWIKTHMPEADVSFYHPAGLYRLPGTLHEKTGRAKVLLMHHQGSCRPVFVEPVYDEPAVEYSGNEAVSHRQCFYGNLLKLAKPGLRSTFISCMLAKEAVKGGIPYEEALKQILRWNQSYANPPHAEDTVVQKVAYEYNR